MRYKKRSPANSTTVVTKDAAATFVNSSASHSTVTSIASTNTVTSSVSTSTGTSTTSISTTESHAFNGSMTSSASASPVTSSTFTGTGSLSSSISTFSSNPSTDAETSNIFNNTITLNAATSTVTSNATNASSINPSDVTTYMTTPNLDSTNPSSLKAQSSVEYLNDNRDLTIALSVSFSVICLVIFIAVIIIVHRNCRRKRLSLKRGPVRIEVPDIFVRLSDQLVSHKHDQYISQSPAVLGMEEIQRISSSSIINSKIPDKKADNLGTVSHRVEAIATIDITNHTFQGTAKSRKKGDNRVFVPEIAKVQVVTRSRNTDGFHKQEHKEDGVSETLKVLNQTIEDETFTEIKL